MEKPTPPEPRRIVTGIYLLLSAASYIVSNVLLRPESTGSFDKTVGIATRVIAAGSLLRAAHHIAIKWKRG